MKITALIENTHAPACPELSIEPGLSLWIALNERHILFDSGVSGAFIQNAAQLNIDVSQADLVVLSHHHYDHAGGLRAFTDVNANAPIYLGKTETEDLRLSVFGLLKKPIGMDESLLIDSMHRFHYVDAFAEISPDVYLMSDVPKRHSLPKGNRHLFKVVQGKKVRDDFRHEIVMLIRQPGGLVVFSGCSHNGILNVLDAVVQRFPGERILALLGGFHLIGIPFLNTLAGSPNQIRALGQAILEYPVDMVYTCHCTGLKAYPILKEVMDSQLEYFAAGSVVEL